MFIWIILRTTVSDLLDLSVKKSLGQSLHDRGPAEDLCPADWTELEVLPAVVTHQVAGDTLVDPHSSHLLQTHGTLQLTPPV